jgi:dTDP-4-dehydrorhamnose reductase
VLADPVHILVTGGAGQVGLELARADWPEGVVLHRPGRELLDLSDPVSIRDAFGATPYAAVINAAAYTAVDKAETEVAAAFAANALGPAAIAQIAREADVPMVHVSTDYVFDGAADRPYVEDDPVGPLGIYGASKLAGELAARLAAPRSVVLRTAWVLSPFRANFAKTMLRLAGERDTVRVVADQRGCPTSARDIADVLKTITLRMIAERNSPTGIYHFVNKGETTWAGLAEAVFEASAARGGPSARVEPITTADYPTPARRPANSRLSTAKLERDYGIAPRPWREAVEQIVGELNEGAPR